MKGESEMQKVFSIFRYVLYFIIGNLLFTFIFSMTQFFCYYSFFGLTYNIIEIYLDNSKNLFLIYIILFFIFLLFIFLYNRYYINKLNKALEDIKRKERNNREK